MKACAEYGREDVDNISKEVEGKDSDEVGMTLVVCNHVQNQ